MIVGNIILGIREAITDMPGTMLAPSGLVLTPVVDPNGTIAPGTYFAVVTNSNLYGETNPSNEASCTIALPNNAIQVSYTPNTVASAITKSNVYIGNSSGNEFLSFTGGFQTTPITILSLALDQGFPPGANRNTAYLPDLNGDAFSSNSLFRWLNDALMVASQVAGGLLDYSGFSTVSGQPLYVAPGQWKRISSVWYDGYPLAMDDAGNYFRRNSITASVLASAATSFFTDRMSMELWPQPSRSGAQTTLAAPLGATDTQAVLVSAAGFLLTNGFVKIGSEIMGYSGISGNTLKNLTRALSGTVAAAVASGGVASELNLFFQGWRMYAPTFKPGDSSLVIPVPVGWETALPLYGLGRAKNAEQNTKEGMELIGQFTKMISDWWRTNRVITGPRQVGEQTNSLEVLPSFGGGWICP